MRRLIATMSVVLALGMLAAACGGDGDDEDAGGSPAATVAESTTTEAEVGGDNPTVVIEMEDFEFAPPSAQGQAGETVTVELENTGQAPHTFTIDDLDVDQQVPPGDKATVKVELPESGEVTFYCRFHRASGMEGSFELT